MDTITPHMRKKSITTQKENPAMHTPKKITMATIIPDTITPKRKA